MLFKVHFAIKNILYILKFIHSHKSQLYLKPSQNLPNLLKTAPTCRNGRLTNSLIHCVNGEPKQDLKLYYYGKLEIT